MSQPYVSPANLPGLSGWYDATQLATGVVSSWTDLSGNGNHAVQATGGNQPTNTASTINGKNALVFNGTSTFLSANGLAPIMTGVDRDCTVFCVSSTSNTGTSQYQYIWGRSVSINPLLGTRYEATATLKVLHRDDAGTLLQPTGGTVVVNVANITTMVSNAGVMDLYLNNAKVITSSSISATTLTIDNFSIGASFRNGTAANWIVGSIGAVVVYNRALSATEIGFVNKSLANTFAIAI